MSDDPEGEIAKFIAERIDYVAALKNCPPDNTADYWRWQGHAEARRQLCEMLGIEVPS